MPTTTNLFKEPKNNITNTNEQLEARIKVLEEAFLVLQQRVKDYESQ